MIEKIQNKRFNKICQYSLKTLHGRILLLAFLVSLLFLPIWLHTIIRELFVNWNSTALMSAGFLCLGILKLWQRREELRDYVAAVDDKLIGYSLLLCGAVALPLCRESVSLQSVVLMLMLVGAAWSTFGAKFFKRFTFPAVLIIASAYPNYAFLVAKVWDAFSSPFVLENLMAKMGSIALNIISLPAVAEARWILLPDGAVEVGPACSGFNMAVQIAGFSLLLGLILNQHWQRILLVVGLGILLALILNVPRIMLLAIAAVYWGQESFDFWHGHWGGQIFSLLLFTVYYYISMAIYRDRSNHKEAKA